ncbi:MAG: hypothetical protein M1823_003320 [Watsoniomyces obsoletus]|nr:MAG: hypothetical protein M1823_003320 [Watsoniomyces obsoletus]
MTQSLDDRHRLSPSPWLDTGVFTLQRDLTPSSGQHNPPLSSSEHDDYVSCTREASELTDAQDLPRMLTPTNKEGPPSDMDLGEIVKITTLDILGNDEITNALRFTRQWLMHLDESIPWGHHGRYKMGEALTCFSIPRDAAPPRRTTVKTKRKMNVRDPSFQPSGGAGSHQKPPTPPETLVNPHTNRRKGTKAFSRTGGDNNLTTSKELAGQPSSSSRSARNQAQTKNQDRPAIVNPNQTNRSSEPRSEQVERPEHLTSNAGDNDDVMEGISDTHPSEPVVDRVLRLMREEVDSWARSSQLPQPSSSTGVVTGKDPLVVRHAVGNMTAVEMLRRQRYVEGRIASAVFFARYARVQLAEWVKSRRNENGQEFGSSRARLIDGISALLTAQGLHDHETPEVKAGRRAWGRRIQEGRRWAVLLKEHGLGVLLLPVHEFMGEHMYKISDQTFENLRQRLAGELVLSHAFSDIGGCVSALLRTSNEPLHMLQLPGEPMMLENTHTVGTAGQTGGDADGQRESMEME